MITMIVVSINIMYSQDIIRDEKESDIGLVAHVIDKHRSEQLHFCVFDNNKDDYIYVGTKYGMWSDGSFELYYYNEKVYDGKIQHLVYGGIILKMGDVIKFKNKSNVGLEIRNIKGTFK